MKKISSYEACAIVEGFDGEEHTQEEQIAAWQHLIDSGVVWSLQGWYGRTAAALIEEGICHHARKNHRDYYGNEVKKTIKQK